MKKSFTFGEAEQSSKFGMFAGVFTPSVLTILGIILFLRTGYVVGMVGLAETLIIMLIAFTICTITGLSLAVISTDKRVKGGGFYYVISRTLGPEFGGALGLTLFISISVAIAFYTIGLGEVLVTINDWPEWITARKIAFAVTLLLFVSAWIGADWATKLQFVVMAIVGLSLLTFFWGGVQNFSQERLAENWVLEQKSESFWIAFALFFPAISGFTQGLNMSGDLKDPSKAIPLGTFLAIAVSMLIYLATAFFLASGSELSELKNNYYVMRELSSVGILVAAGVIAATASSGMASMLGAPRVLQAMGKDRLIPNLSIFAKGHGKDDNPRNAILASLAIALTAIALGNLNFLAPIITMFFLASYALLNYATFFASDTANPSFRPKFKLSHKYVSLAGAIACVVVMLAINPTASIVAASVLFGIFHYLQKTQHQHRWADHQRGAHFKHIREHLIKVNSLPEHPGDWRPQTLIFSKEPDHRRTLLFFSALIEGNSGVTTMVQILEQKNKQKGKQEDKQNGQQKPDRDKVLEEYQASIDDSKAKAFPLVIEAPDFSTGLKILLQAYGVGPIKANTILLNWLSVADNLQSDKQKNYADNINCVLNAGFNVVALAAEFKSFERVDNNGDEPPQIDIWWVGGATSKLMLLFSYLITRTEAWSHAQIRVLAQAKKDGKGRTEKEFEEFLETIRIEASIETLDIINIDTIKQQSKDSQLVFFPAELDGDNFRGRFNIDIKELLTDFPPTAFTIAGEVLELDPDPDDDSEQDNKNGADSSKSNSSNSGSSNSGSKESGSD